MYPMVFVIYVVTPLSGMPANNDSHYFQIKHDEAKGLPDDVSAQEFG